MTGVGITAEYNPLHNGHVYHIKQARELSGADVVVVVMSGCFVQRGEPAVFNKWQRASHAIAAGADIVLELPTYYALSDAGRFAKAGIKILENIGICNYIAFGSECGDIKLLQKVSANLKDVGFQTELNTKSIAGMSYPKARFEAYKERFKSASQEELNVLSNPNDILGLSYISALNDDSDNEVNDNSAGNCRIKPIAIQRMGAGYLNEYDLDAEFQSATAIRELIKELTNNDSALKSVCANNKAAQGYKTRDDALQKIKNAVPSYVYEDILKLDNIIEERNNKIHDMLRMILLSSKESNLEDTPSAGEGISNKLIESARVSNNIEDLISLTKSKRYTYTRISRLLMQTLLNIRRYDYITDKDGEILPSYARILGLSSQGRDAIKNMKRNDLNSIPIVTNINKNIVDVSDESKQFLNLDIHAMDVYNLVSGVNIRENSDYMTIPVTGEGFIH